MEGNDHRGMLQGEYVFEGVDLTFTGSRLVLRAVETGLLGSNVWLLYCWRVVPTCQFCIIICICSGPWTTDHDSCM